jgi:pimeloyl-ACP methyl ester carboxylesterase
VPAAGVNNAGQVVGTVRVSDGGGGSHSEITLWDAGGNPQFLGAGSGVAINASGTVLGYNETLRHPVIWTAADGTTDLISLIDNGTGWTDLYATCINRSGQIAGYGTYAGKTRAFLLTPASSSVDLPASTLALTTFVPGASEAVAVDGIVCDNLRGMAKAWTTENETANKLVISLPAEYAGATVTAELASPGSSSGEVRAVGDKIVYYPPDEYNENQEPTSAENGQITLSAKRTVTLRVRFTHNGRSYVVADKPLLLARAPVVLVHGIQSDPSRWQPLVNALNERGIHVPFVGVNHADVLRGNGPVEIAAKKLRDNVLSAIDAIHNGRDVSGINGSVFSDYHGLKLASRRADVVAWSYGGVITRWYIASTGSSASYAWYHPPIPPDGQSTLNFDADNRPIRKVITLGSMWRGVPLINYLNEASYPATQTRAQLRNAPLTTPVVSSTVGNVIARLPLPYSAPSMEVMAIGSKWMSQLVYGSPTYGESAAPFDEKIAYGAVAGDDNRYPIEIPEIKFVGHVGSLFLDIYGMLNFFQQPTYFPYLTLETRGFGTGNYSDGLVPVWSASIPSTRDMLLGSNKIIPVSHDSYPANIDTQMYVIRALNHSGLEQGRALNVLWNDAERSRIRTRDGTKTWSFASGQIAPYPQSDFYQQIDGIGRLNPFAFGERSVIVPLVKVAKKRTFNNEIEFTVTIGNGGFVLIPDVKVEGAILASGSSVVPPLTPLPQSLGTINLGQSVITNIRFPSIGPVNAPAVLKLRMSATILSEFNRNISITLP